MGLGKVQNGNYIITYTFCNDPKNERRNQLKVFLEKLNKGFVSYEDGPNEDQSTFWGQTKCATKRGYENEVKFIQESLDIFSKSQMQANDFIHFFYAISNRNVPLIKKIIIKPSFNV